MVKKKFSDIIFILLIIVAIVPACSRQKSIGQDSAGGKKISQEKPWQERSTKENIYLEGENMKGLNESQIAQKLDMYAKKLNVEPKDAVMDDRSWRVVEEEQAGSKLNVEKTLDALFSAKDGENVKLTVEKIEPSVTSEGLNQKVVEIGSYRTPLLDRQDSRINNIELAAGKIDGARIGPGEEFSFNSTLGKRTQAKGYEEAPVIIKTEEGYKKGYGVGGGICQLSTTIYNAAEKVGLEITERHVHSKDVGYVPDGKDATVSYGSVDFKFRNNRGYPIMLKVNVSQKSLLVRILENRN